MKKSINNKGFTLIELLVVISIISLLSSIVIASLNSAREKARDTKRLSDMRQIQTALELYRNTYGRYPDPTSQADCGGWDSGGDGSFISALVTNNFLPSTVLDPTINNACGNYAYYRYPASTASPYVGCTRTFYILGIRDLESTPSPYPSSPGFSCPTRNWQSEFEWVIGREE